MEHNIRLIDQEVNLSKDNVIERIRELLKEVKILGQAETSRMLEEISHGLEVSSKSTRDTRVIKKETKKEVKGVKCSTDGKKNAKKVRCTREIRRIKNSGSRGCAK
ncbi:hypothetical protein [Wolbachia endosymbiont of Trichogramma pretiosum]|uniref:hypothetical protein n=1 Tax=Wolbachia endosymbiont of Trichogramma pretiosum TaxID=125593 RepID=UPI00083972CF|nr:hypothetical protein [Wolbachia endosymbiont of Trichogramma pretiosum]OCA05851.1 hypothetical protein wTpre_169 [Wolbachia endosymbiont of Trichogramma pretiosum]